MVRLSSQDHQTVHEVAARLYELSDVETFTATAVKCLAQLVDADVTAFNEVNFKARRMLTVIDNHELQLLYHRRQPEFESLMHQNPLISHYARQHDTPRKISDFMSLKEWRSTQIFDEFYRRALGSYQIAMVLPLEVPTIAAFAFNRAASDFTQRHRALLTVLQPHVTQAYKNAVVYTQTIERVQTREEMLDACGVGWIDLDETLSITRSSPTIPDTFESFFRTQNLDDKKLPPELAAWVAGQLERAHSGQPVSAFVVENASGRLTVRLLASERSSTWSLVAERFVGVDSPQPLRALGLTERQAETLYWLAQGKSNAEIAIILNISIRTVETHVYRIFDILKVGNRTEAATAALNHLTSRG